MNYPKEFVAKVKKQFPDDEELHQALDRNCIIVGAMLRQAANRGLPAEWIIKTLNEGDAKPVKREAEAIFQSQELYLEWLDHFKKRWGVTFFDLGIEE